MDDNSSGEQFSSLMSMELKELIRKLTEPVVPEKMEQRYKCGICGNTYELQRSYNAHLRRHELANHFKCDECGLGFACTFDWRQHKLTHYRQRTSFECLVCDEQFGIWSTCRDHVKSAHMTHKNSVCKYCGHQLKNYWKYMYHTQIELEKREASASELSTSKSSPVKRETCATADNQPTAPSTSSKKPVGCDTCMLIYEDDTHREIHEIFHYHQQVFGGKSK